MVQHLTWRDSLTLRRMNAKRPPLKLDIQRAASTAWQDSGRDTLATYPRLMHDTKGRGEENLLDWSVRLTSRMGVDGRHEPWMWLSVSVDLPLDCQRCLGVVDVHVVVDRAFRFVDTEALAAAQDEAAPEDVLVVDHEFDLACLIEDEVLLASPLAPSHADCPMAVPSGCGADEGATHPFDVLAHWKDQLD